MRKIVPAVFGLIFAGSAMAANVPAAVAPPMDFSTPQAALLTYFTLIAYGDMDVLQKVSTTPTTPEEKLAAECGKDENLWVPHLINAIRDHFPAGMLADVPDVRKGAAAYKVVVDHMDVTVKGDTATIRQAGQPATAPADDLKIVLRKEAGDWKIVLKESTMIPCFKNPTVKQIEFAKALRDCYVQTADDVLAGKYTSPVVASKACDARIKAVNDKYLHPTTAPAGK